MMLLWAADADGAARDSPLLAIPLPSPDWEPALKLDSTTRAIVGVMFISALTPLASLLLLLLVMPWTPPDTEAKGWHAMRCWVLYALEAVGIWSLLPVCAQGLKPRTSHTLCSSLPACHMPLLSSPTFEPLRGKVCVLMLLAATAQTTLPLPTLSHAWLAELTSTAAAAAPNAATAVAAAAKASGLADEMGAADSSWLRIELKLGCSIALFA